ncbi:RTX toxin RtxA domain protein [Vibrio cholerae]|nr:RTX toxin RtxA domain protein [Vibrio cholerae]
MSTHKPAAIFVLKVWVVTTVFTLMSPMVTSISRAAVRTTPLFGKVAVVILMPKVWNMPKQMRLYSLRLRCMVFRSLTATNSILSVP